MKWINNNIIMVTFATMATMICGLMMYAYQTKQELKRLGEGQHTVITFIELRGKTYQDTIVIKNIDSTVRTRQYSERGILDWTTENKQPISKF